MAVLQIGLRSSISFGYNKEKCCRVFLERGNMYTKVWLRKMLTQALKIAFGSSLAIYVATILHLDNTAAAGSIALLTIVTTKWETVRLAMYRIIAFVLSISIGTIMFTSIKSQWLAYGIYILLVIIVSELLKIKSTISVSAVIGMHFMTAEEITLEFTENEFALVFVGITIAFILNLFHDYKGQKERLLQGIVYAETGMKQILADLAAFLLKQDVESDVWQEIDSMEKKLQELIREAYEYQDNTFQSHPGYYIDYFEMRSKQCGILRNLHTEVKRMRSMPEQARIVAEYVLYLKDYVTEKNRPKAQMERLHKMIESMEQQPLPESREELVSCALLYHILMDIGEFLQFKEQFVNLMDENKLRIYWKEEMEHVHEHDRSIAESNEKDRKSVV